MEKLNTCDEVINAFANEKLMSKEKFSNNYFGVFYECGCGENHDVNSSIYNMCAFNVKFFFECYNGYVTFVKIKGIFKMRAVELWTCKKEIYYEAIDIISP